MLIGIDPFMAEGIFTKEIHHYGYGSLEFYDMSMDQIYVDSSPDELPLDKPDDWRYSTILNAKFEGNLEGGSIEANNMLIESIKFQRRKNHELEWEEIAEKAYRKDGRIFYEIMDKFVSSGELYNYCIVPSTATVDGNRVVSKPVKVEFTSIFLSNKHDNFELMYNLDLSTIESNLANAVFTPQNSKYPIVVSSDMDYTSFDINALFLSVKPDDYFGVIDVRTERLQRERLFTFLKDGQPKVYRDGDGRLKLVSVVGNPTETPSNFKAGLSDIQVSFVEIGEVNGETLKKVDLYSFERGEYYCHLFKKNMMF